MSLTKRLQNRGEDRGAALVEFAVVLLVLLPLLSVVFDAGLGYAAARSSSSIVRSAAQVGVRAGENRNADFLILQALKAEYGNGADVTSIIVYESDPAGTGDFDPACVGNGWCRWYDVRPERPRRKLVSARPPPNERRCALPRRCGRQLEASSNRPGN